MIPRLRYGEGKLPHSEAYYWFVAVGIILSWTITYLIIIIAFLILYVAPVVNSL